MDHDAHISDVFLRNITAILPQYVFWKNTESVYLGCNQHYAELVGLSSPKKIVGKTDDDLPWQPTGDTSRFFRKGDQAAMRGDNILNQEETLSLPNGKTLITLVSKSPIIDEDGRVLGIVGYFTDVTEFKRAQQEAESANHAKSEFLANMSHDIRTPLTGILGMAEAIAESELNNLEIQRYANELVKAGERLLSLLNEVLELTRFEQGDFSNESIIFYPKETVEEVVDLLLPSIRKKGLTFSLEYDTQIPNLCIGDQMAWHRILLNLMSNAIKFTASGRIDLSLHLVKDSKKQTNLKCCIHDTGIGISQAQQEEIFEPFCRLTPAYQGVYKGFGLGLNIVKRLIKHLNGKIEIDSVPKKGTTVTVTLPFHDGSHDRSLPSTPLKILVIEHDRGAQLAAHQQFTALGCRIEMVNSGRAAIERIQTCSFDLIITELEPPDMPGDQITQALSLATQGLLTTIIVLTADITRKQIQACEQSGIDCILIKPLTEEIARHCLKCIREKGQRN